MTTIIGRPLESVSQGSAGTEEWLVRDDYTGFESFHQTLVLGTDTTITFSSQVRMVRVTNWDSTARILVKNGAITSNTDATASRVGRAPTPDVPNSEVFPITTNSIHIRSALASEVTVEGFF